MKTARYILTFVHLVKKVRDRKYELHLLTFFLFWIVAGYCLAQVLFLIGVQIVNELMK